MPKDLIITKELKFYQAVKLAINKREFINLTYKQA